MHWGVEYYGYVNFALDLAEEHGFQNLAEVGCGDGAISVELARRYPDRQFVGYDLSERSIAFANAYAAGIKNLTFHAEDFEKAPQQYDVVLCVETLEHIPDEEIDSFLKTIHRKLNDSGVLVITIPSVNVPLNPKHYRHYNVELLTEQATQHFHVKESYYIHNQKTFGYHILRFLLINRIFVLQHLRLRKWLFGLYDRWYKKAAPETGSHVVAVLEKK